MESIKITNEKERMRGEKKKGVHTHVCNFVAAPLKNTRTDTSYIPSLRGAGSAGTGCDAEARMSASIAR